MIGKSTGYSNASSTLKKIFDMHWESGVETNSKAGTAIMKSIRAELDKEKTYWKVVITKEGKRRFVKTSTPQAVGTIVNRDGITLNTKLRNFIQFRTYGTTGTTVVGVPMKSGRTEIRENGMIVDSTPVDGISKESINILNKLNSGVANNTMGSKTHSGGKMWTHYKDNTRGKSLDSFDGKWERRDFAARGRRSAMGTVSDILNKGYEAALARREKYTKQPLRKVS